MAEPPLVFVHSQFRMKKAGLMILNGLPSVMFVATTGWHGPLWHLCLLGVFLVCGAYWVYTTGLYFIQCNTRTRIEVSEDGIRISDSRAGVLFSSSWSGITEYVRKPAGKQMFSDNVPRWEIAAGDQRATIPHLAEHAQFQQFVFRHLPAQAVPPQYRLTEKGRTELSLPIKEYSLIADEDGLRADSAANQVDIHWHDLLFVEEFQYSIDSEGPNESIPRIHICSKTDQFLLTKSWDRYEDIRTLVLEKAPPTAVVVLASS